MKLKHVKISNPRSYIHPDNYLDSYKLRDKIKMRSKLMLVEGYFNAERRRYIENEIGSI